MDDINIGGNNENDTGNAPNRIRQTMKPIFITIIVVSILLSSTFGAVFGFMAGSAASYMSNILEDKIGKVWPKELRGDRVQNIQSITEEQSAVIDVVEKKTSAVVSIIVTKNVQRARQFSPFDPFDFFFDPFSQRGVQGSQGENERQQIGGGSGFLVTKEGMIVTNKHVVADINAEYTVITNDGKEHQAKVLARDPVKDIAIMKIEGSNFPFLEFGSSSELKIGQTVIAIGNSLGEFSNTVSKGIISGLRRNITAGSGLGDTEQLRDIIQTDAAINPGNSGGPLLDIAGKVIGVNVAKAQAENIGFAIPIDQVKRSVEQVKTTGKISAPFVGVRYVIINSEIQQDNNLPFNYGALVARGQSVTDFAVMPGSPADKAGIVENDIILELNGEKIDQENTLGDLIFKYNVGDTLELKVWRKGNTMDIKLKTEERK